MDEEGGSTNSKKIYHIDDQNYFLLLVKLLVGEVLGIEGKGEIPPDTLVSTDNWNDLLPLNRPMDPKEQEKVLAILDLDMPVQGSVVGRSIRMSNPGIAIVIFSGKSQEEGEEIRKELLQVQACRGSQAVDSSDSSKAVIFVKKGKEGKEVLKQIIRNFLQNGG